uniref:Glutathione S-transferase n=1 Tax=Coturnix japonica TaxID=93934 RepID=A0A8C2TA07_COTJA
MRGPLPPHHTLFTPPPLVLRCGLDGFGWGGGTMGSSSASGGGRTGGSQTLEGVRLGGSPIGFLCGDGGAIDLGAILAPPSVRAPFAPPHRPRACALRPHCGGGGHRTHGAGGGHLPPSPCLYVPMGGGLTAVCAPPSWPTPSACCWSTPGPPIEDKLYSCGKQPPNYDKSQWINEKEKLGLDFPNLPYYIDGDVKLTQSNAILRYIARKHNMCGDTEQERQRVDVLENQVMDFRMSLVMVCYSPDFEKLKPGYLEQLPGKLKLFSTFLGDRKWFAGDKLTFVDFLMFDVLDQNRIFSPRCLEPYSNLCGFMERFGALEKVAAYLKSSRFQKMPINNKMAKWGGKKE